MSAEPDDSSATYYTYSVVSLTEPPEEAVHERVKRPNSWVMDEKLHRVIQQYTSEIEADRRDLPDPVLGRRVASLRQTSATYKLLAIMIPSRITRTMS